LFFHMRSFENSRNQFKMISIGGSLRKPPVQIYS
jgi:hypothetical protein